MAPMTRSRVPVSQDTLERGWMNSDIRVERELSEEPTLSYNDEKDLLNFDSIKDFESNIDYDLKRMPLKGPEDEEDVLHPLRGAANRVGREVERFAEVLDSHNPQIVTDPSIRQEKMFALIKQFHFIALGTVDRLRRKHESERRKSEGRKWRRKMRGFKITQDDDLGVDNRDECVSIVLGSQTTIQDLDHWEQEAQTWDLLHRLATVRFGPKLQTQKPIHRYTSNQELWKHFLATEELALERNTILQWLKDTAEESGEDLDVIVEDLQKNAERGDIIAHGWLHTKAAIKDHKRRTALSHAIDPKAPDINKELLNPTKTEPITTQLDPDAPTRQVRKLAVQDQYFERAIWLGCYELLRRGISPTKINEWCMERTEIWRAASMSGISFESLEEDSEPSNIDAMIRWRRMCLSIARNGGGNDYEKAVYGLLSGDVTSLEHVCRSWDDFVFIHYNALLRTEFDNYLRKMRVQLTGLEPLLSLGNLDTTKIHGDSQNMESRIISSLMSNSRTAKESTKPMKLIQGVLITDQFAHFIFEQGLALSKIANAKEESRIIPPSKHQLDENDLTKNISFDDHDSLRVLTHILLVFLGLGLDLGGVYREIEVQNVIVAYISFLKLAGKEELIPLYCSQLSGKRKYSVLSRCLIDVTDEDQRITQIKLIRELGLDAHEFVSLQARYLLDDFPDNTLDYPALGKFKLFLDSPDTTSSPRILKRDFIGDEYSVERINLLLIRSLQWYLLVDGLWVEAFRLGTLIYLRFYKHMNLCAAKMLSINVPSKTLMERKTRAVLGENINLFNIESDEENDLKGYMLSEAMNFRELEILIECLDNIDTATCLDDIKNQGLSSQLPPISFKEWRHSYQIACEETRSCAGLLMKNWLLETPNESIQNELRLTRLAYLPETLLAYITTLQYAGLHINRDFLLEAMEISSILVEEGSDTLGIFVKTGRLKEMVDNLARTSAHEQKSEVGLWKYGMLSLKIY